MSLNRRGFLQRATSAAAAWAVPGWYRDEVAAQAVNRPQQSANGRPTIALIGCGGRGRGVAKQAAKHGDIIALCDVDSKHLDNARRIWPKAQGYKDFRHVLERDDLDLVICGTVDHWHALVSMAAMRAGKDVYCEKPLTLTIDEGRRLSSEAARTGRILQTGTQQRSDPGFRLACEVVRNKRIGKLEKVEVILPAGRNEGPFPETKAPASLDWDFWQGPVKPVPYVRERSHVTFRYWYDYSGGTMTDWGAHHNDIALWAIGAERSGPISVKGKPLVKMIPGGYSAASEYQLEYRYANGVLHTCESTRSSAWYGAKLSDQGRHHGIKFIGSEGWVWVTRGELTASQPEILEEPFTANDDRLYPSDNHMGNFFDSVRSRKPAICEAEIGHRSATVCHLGVIAVRLGREIQWDPGAERFVGDQEAQSMVARPMRQGWGYEMI